MNFDEQTYEMIEAYLDQTLSDSERSFFEDRIKAETLLAEEVKIHREMRQQYSDIDAIDTMLDYDKKTLTDLKNHLRSEEIQDLSKKIKEGKKIYDTGSKKKPLTTYFYYVAAAILLVFLVSRLFITSDTTPQELYAEYKDWQNLPSLTVKGQDQNDLAKGEALFFQGEYTEAITFFSSNEYNKNPQVLIYLGISYLESNDFEKALTTFDQLLYSNTLDASKAHWYLTLTYLKQGNSKKAIEQLQLLRSNNNNYEYEKARELLSVLNDE